MFNSCSLFLKDPMPTLKEEILLLLEEGFYFLLNPWTYLGHSARYSPGSLYTTVTRLEQKGLIKKITRKGRKQLKLTSLGKAVLEKHRTDANKQRPSWDRKWRLVIFDIPERQAELRQHLRAYLKAMGFGKVQRSVWISPYDHSSEIRRYLRKIQLSDFVFQLLVDIFEGLPGDMIASSFWDLQRLHDQYIKFSRDWTVRLGKLEKSAKKSADFDAALLRRCLSHLTWDYQSIAALDPHLPLELLPADWGGTAARKLVENWQKKYSPE